MSGVICSGLCCICVCLNGWLSVLRLVSCLMRCVGIFLCLMWLCVVFCLMCRVGSWVVMLCCVWIVCWLRCVFCCWWMCRV